MPSRNKESAHVSRDRSVPASNAEQVVAGAIAAATNRARLLVIAESVAWGFTVAAVSVPAGALLAAAILAWRWKSTSRASVVRRFERAQPDAANLFVTVEELARDALDAKAPVRARVFQHAAVWSQRIDRRVVFPATRAVGGVAIAILAWTVVQTAERWRPARPAPQSPTQSSSGVPPATPVRPRLHVNVELQPPSYTMLNASTLVDPDHIQAIEGSVAVLSIDASA